MHLGQIGLEQIWHWSTISWSGCLEQRCVLRLGVDGRCAVGVLALSRRFGSDLVSVAGVAQGTSTGQAWDLPLDSSSDVCSHLALVFGTRITIGELVGGMVGFDSFCCHVFCSHSSRGADDVSV